MEFGENMIITERMKVYPISIENIIETFSAVKEGHYIRKKCDF